MPSASGDYEYLLRAYGCAGCYFFISKTGLQAITSTIFGRYLDTIINKHKDSESHIVQETESTTAKVAAILSVIFLTAINCAGVRESVILQRFLTTVKLFIILYIIYRCSI